MGFKRTVNMGLFDAFKKAFDNKDYSESPAKYEQTNARASHVLVSSESEAQSLKDQIEAGTLDFAECAMKFSSCNSASTGGKLGRFNPGQMVPEFDDAVFGVMDNGITFEPKNAIGTICGPVKTKFGYHLIKIETRNMADFDFRAKEGKL
eukprot:CAMPEP_0119314590 /NCGR_PEP_ID=MMETSP1333-20130426/33234_1 /TAXON_ID=418940 /ORGANISM="Scyphosphaera apsteinii, Strain RCC1455" /LENGTH=149 /DNA_ID=CAMNT_0007319731 /DNA_START=152 /DNA_END=601 /DNA_ORIENTATION=-